MTRVHVDLEVLAQCAEGTLTEAEARAVREHLVECRSCLAAYGDAVRYRAAWLSDLEAFRLQDEDRSLVPERSAGMRRQGWFTYRSLALAGGLAAGLVVVSILLSPRSDAPTLGFRLGPATLASIARSSPQGLVLPGAEGRLDGAYPERGAGAGVNSVQLDDELRAAIDAYERGTKTAEKGARVVAGFLADGDVAAANDYAREALSAHPDDVPLLVFAAAARTRANDLPGAEHLLRGAIRRAPSDPVVALDLGLVLCMAGHGKEARTWFERAAASEVPAVATRARREMASCAATGGRD